MIAQDSSSLSAQVAELALKTQVFMFNFEKPWTWASGWKSPVYNDNRLHSSFHKNRLVILEAIKEIIRGENIEFDAILGIPTGGLAWASLLAKEFQKPLFMKENDSVYELKLEIKKDGEKQFPVAKTELIVTNAPWGIPEGIIQAHYNQIGFAYVREKEKAHGTGKIIEGFFDTGENCDFKIFLPIDNTEKNPENHLPENIQEILSTQKLYTKAQSNGVIKVEKIKNLDGIKFIGVEDLISTGGSSLKDVELVRSLGGTVKDLISIFNYAFPKRFAEKKFKEAGVNLHNVLNFEQLLAEADATNLLTTSQLERLQVWHGNPEAYSQAHGGK